MENGWTDHRENLVLGALRDPRIFQPKLCIYYAFACQEGMKEHP